jgi:solute carrier family 35 (UDP-xylose/UDP-N-acetylglucosamine transporter), member B4
VDLFDNGNFNTVSYFTKNRNFCVKNVFKLNKLTDSLTTTLVTTIRKFISLLISLIIFQNLFGLYDWIGAIFVFGGSFYFFYQ